MTEQGDRHPVREVDELLHCCPFQRPRTIEIVEMDVAVSMVWVKLESQLVKDGPDVPVGYVSLLLWSLRLVDQ